MIEQKLKQGRITFSKDLSDKDQDKIVSYLNTLDQLENINLDENCLSLTYPFPLFTMNIFRTQLQTVFPEYEINRSWKASIKAYMEQNERDYIVFQPGWSRYVEDIYIHYFDQRHGGKRDVKNMLWRKYQKKRVEVTK